MQQTMLDAHRDSANFLGKADAQLRAWLKMFRPHNLLTVARRHGTDKRAAGREATLQDQLEQSSAQRHQQLAADHTSPSLKLMKQERSEQLTDALLNLLDGEPAAVVLKHYYNLSVADIAKQLGRTRDAVAGPAAARRKQRSGNLSLNHPYGVGHGSRRKPGLTPMQLMAFHLIIPAYLLKEAA